MQGPCTSLACVLLLPLLKHLFLKLQKLFLNLQLGLGKVHSLFILDLFRATLFLCTCLLRRYDLIVIHRGGGGGDKDSNSSSVTDAHIFFHLLLGAFG